MIYETVTQDGVIAVVAVGLSGGTRRERPIETHFANLEAAYEMTDRLNSGDASVDLNGPVFCEQHVKTLWPHPSESGSDGCCAGPGMWLPNAELAEYGIPMRQVT